jgi:hypothetical protein
MRIFQVLLKPLGDFLFSYLRMLPWDATFNQDRFSDVLIEHLNNGKVAHSIDLSDATNTFPLNFERECMLALVRRIQKYIERQEKDHYAHTKKRSYEAEDSFKLFESYIHVFEVISKSEWFYKDRMIRWKKGQPLGLYPSFPAFAITHGCLLYCLAKQAHVGINSFYILGDDVVILDDNLLLLYKDMLSRLGCIISEHKSISSSNVCEFAGKVIDKYKSHSLFKWRFTSQDNFVDLIKNFGTKIIELFPRNIRSVAKIIAPLPEVLIPFGAGKNPDGLSILERIKGFEDFIELDESSEVHIRAKQVFKSEDILEFYSRYVSDKKRQAFFDVFLYEFFSDRETTVSRLLGHISELQYPEFYKFMNFTCKIMELYRDPGEKARFLNQAIGAFKLQKHLYPQKWLKKFIREFEAIYGLNSDDDSKRTTLLTRLKKLLNIK